MEPVQDVFRQRGLGISTTPEISPASLASAPLITNASLDAALLRHNVVTTLADYSLSAR